MAGVKSIARFKLVCYTSKKLADGSHPIMLRITYGTSVYKSTKYSCKESDWDKKGEFIKNRNYPDVDDVNKYLSDFKSKVVSKRNYYQSNEILYTAKKLADSVEDTTIQYNRLSIINYLKHYIIDLEKAGASKHTRSNYATLLMHLNVFRKGNELLFTDINTLWCQGFSSHLKNKGLKNGSINTIYSKLSSIYNIAIDNDIVPLNMFPFRKYKYWVHFKVTNKKKSLTKEDMFNLHGYLGDIYCGIDTNSYVEELQHRHTKTFALATFVFGYMAQGLAMIDIALLKKDMFSIFSRIETVRNPMYIKGDNNKKSKKDAYIEVENEYYRIETNRSKTNVPVTIIIPKSEITEFIIEPFLHTAHLRNGYVFPILQNNKHAYHYLTIDQRDNAINTTQQLVNKNLKVAIKDCNEKRNTSTNEDITFYAMRHTYASVSYYEGANAALLAKTMGRAKSGIEGYIKDLVIEDEIIVANKKIF